MLCSIVCNKCGHEEVKDSEAEIVFDDELCSECEGDCQVIEIASEVI